MKYYDINNFLNELNSRTLKTGTYFLEGFMNNDYFKVNKNIKIKKLKSKYKINFLGSNIIIFKNKIVYKPKNELLFYFVNLVSRILKSNKISKKLKHKNIIYKFEFILLTSRLCIDMKYFK